MKTGISEWWHKLTTWLTSFIDSLDVYDILVILASGNILSCLVTPHEGIPGYLINLAGAEQELLIKTIYSGFMLLVILGAWRLTPGLPNLMLLMIPIGLHIGLIIWRAITGDGIWAAVGAWLGVTLALRQIVVLLTRIAELEAVISLTKQDTDGETADVGDYRGPGAI